LGKFVRFDLRFDLLAFCFLLARALSVFCSPARCLFSVRPRGVCLVGLRAVCFAVSMQGVVLCDTVGGLEFSRLDIDPPGDRY